MVGADDRRAIASVRVVAYFCVYLMASEHGVQPAPYQSDKALAETGDPVLSLIAVKRE